MIVKFTASSIKLFVNSPAPLYVYDSINRLIVSQRTHKRNSGLVKARIDARHLDWGYFQNYGTTMPFSWEVADYGLRNRKRARLRKKRRFLSLHSERINYGVFKSPMVSIVRSKEYPFADMFSHHVGIAIRNNVSVLLFASESDATMFFTLLDQVP
jgi:hypothetical protein